MAAGVTRREVRCRDARFRSRGRKSTRAESLTIGRCSRNCRTSCRRSSGRVLRWRARSGRRPCSLHPNRYWAMASVARAKESPSFPPPPAVTSRTIGSPPGRRAPDPARRWEWASGGLTPPARLIRPLGGRPASLVLLLLVLLVPRVLADLAVLGHLHLHRLAVLRLE